MLKFATAWLWFQMIANDAYVLERFANANACELIMFVERFKGSLNIEINSWRKFVKCYNL